MCNCITLINEQLAVRNTQLTPTIGLQDGVMKFVGVRIHTHKIDEHSKNGPVSVTASYCPFCGKKYPRADVEREDW